MNIVALDTGKFKTVACMYNSDTGQERMATIATTPQALCDLLAGESPDRVVLEISPLAGWMGDLVRGMDIELQVANVAGEAWKFKNLKSKSDQKDARKLAVLSVIGELPLVYLPQKRVRQWRSLIGYRKMLVESGGSIKSRMRALLCEQGMGHAGGKKGWTEAGVAVLRREARALSECGAEDLWRGQLALELARLESLEGQIRQVEEKLETLASEDDRVRRVRTIPGVGPRLAETIVALLADAGRFKTRQQVASYAGLAPRRHQSGESDPQLGISRQGPKLLRSLLVQVGWIAQRYNPQVREWFAGACKSSASRRKIAVVAVARKLLVLAWVLLRDERDYEVRATPPAEQDGDEGRSTGEGVPEADRGMARPGRGWNNKEGRQNRSGALPPNPRDLALSAPPVGMLEEA